jgi:ABC-type dipeptide/oligopeptide/nickel transport system permease component
VLRYVVRRLLWTGLTVLFVSVLTFLLVFAGPTDPARALVGERAQGVSVEQVRKRYGIDQSLHAQYLHYMGHLARGDLGDSYYFNRPVREVLFERFPATALLAVSIMLVAVLLGIPMGVVAALRCNTLADRGLMIVGLLAISMPTFFFGLILLYRAVVLAVGVVVEHGREGARPVRQTDVGREGDPVRQGDEDVTQEADLVFWRRAPGGHRVSSGGLSASPSRPSRGTASPRRSRWGSRRGRTPCPA